MKDVFEIAVCDDSTFDRFVIAEMIDGYFKDKSFLYHVTEYCNEVTLIDDIEESNRYDIIFLDIYLNSLLGIEVAKKLRSGGYNGKIVFLTASDKYAVESYDVDAAGYLLKPEYISYDNIRYIESSNTKCLIHCSDGKVHTVYTRLDLVENDIDDKRFLRCHRSFLVNLYYVRSMNENFVMDNDEIVLVRKKSIKDIRRMYLEYNSNAVLTGNLAEIAGV